MKSKLRLAVGTSVLVVAFGVSGFASVYGQTDPDTTVTTTSTQHDPGTTTTANSSQELSKRLEARKKKLQVRLFEYQKNRIKQRCKPAQGLLKRAEGRIKGLETSRTQVYTNLLDRLTKLSAKLKEKGLDTTELDTQLAELKTKVDTFNTKLAEYKQAVADLAAMDCQTDPEAFHASLETARLLRLDLRNVGGQIKTYLKETIKASLVELRRSLGGGSTDQTNQAGDTTESGGSEDQSSDTEQQNEGGQ